jgi:thioredoxin 1
MKLQQLTSENFNESVEKEYCLVEFGADWCAPCKKLHPILEKLSSKIKVFTVDIDSENELASEFNIKSVPAMILFHEGKPMADENGSLQINGKKIASKIGLLSESKLVDWIESYSHHKLG